MVGRNGIDRCRKGEREGRNWVIPSEGIARYLGRIIMFLIETHILVSSRSNACRSPKNFAQFFPPATPTRGTSRDMGIKRPSDFILTLEDNDIVSQSESESEPDTNVSNKNQKNKKRKTDDDLNSDFEFDGYGVLGGLKSIDDDGWGFTGIPGMKESAGVDLEGIIARRRGKSNNEKGDDDEAISNDDDEKEEEDEEDDDEEKEETEEESDDDDEFAGIEDDLGT